MNYLTSVEVGKIVHVAAYQIRLFLGTANHEDFSGDAKASILAFHQDPNEFSDEILLEKGAHVDDAHQYPVRIELRGINPKGAAQVVAKGIWGVARKKALTVLRRELVHPTKPLALRIAGSSSFEFNRAGVDKSLPIHFLRTSWKKVLDQMQYKPGRFIDSYTNRIVIAADGDGTIYDGPKTTHLPLLKDSPVFAPMMKYLQAGGIFMLVSGNDLGRSFKRLIAGIPPEYHCQLLVAANGGADLACVGEGIKPMLIKDYDTKALQYIEHDYQQPLLDIIYIGDDGSPDGNDRAAFETVGPNRSFLVSTIEDTKVLLEKWMYERKIDIT